MASSAGTATTTATQTLRDGLSKRSNPQHSSHANLNGLSSLYALQPLQPLRTKRKYRHVAAVHSELRASTLSHDSQAAPSFLGFRNLMVIVLIVGNLRLMIENFKKYGVLICIRCHDYRSQDIRLGLVLYFIIPLHLLVAYIVESAAAQQANASVRSIGRKRSGSATPGGSYIPTNEEVKKFQSTWKLVAWIHGINASLCLLITSVVVYFYIHHPLIGTLSEVHAIIVWLKTASYAFTNRDLRHAYLHPSKRPEDAVPEIYERCPYPQNITLNNLIYFWWAPTLVYQPVYPRTKTIRWVFVGKRMAEVFGLSVFMWVVSAQYAVPVLMNSLEMMASLDLASILERLMKLSTISLVVWLAGFFALFQSFLNALAEVMKFGDREFYEAWWNSASVGQYWRTWNKPVYQFMKRHVFSPLVGRGWSPYSASVGVFVFSGVLHELLVGIPTHNIIGVAFLGMVSQLPLIALTQPMEKMNGVNGKIMGNCIFWVSFTLIGQPLAALLYFYAWQAKYGSVSKTVQP